LRHDELIDAKLKVLYGERNEKKEDNEQEEEHKEDNGVDQE
jgi:hypothetical protein